MNSVTIVSNGEKVEIPLGGSDYTAGDGITIEGDTISVTTPVKGMTQAEYDTLSDDEKQKDVVYMVDEPPWTPVPLSIQEYDTEDGWHVRKWSDGYVEMSVQKSVDFQKESSVWLGGLLYAVPSIPLPLQLVRCDRTGLYPLAGRWADNPDDSKAGFLVSYNAPAIPVTDNETGEFNFYRPNDTASKRLRVTYSIEVAGRWK